MAYDAVERDEAHARLALIEFKEGKLPEWPPESAKIPRAHPTSRSGWFDVVTNGRVATDERFRPTLTFHTE